MAAASLSLGAALAVLFFFVTVPNQRRQSSQEDHAQEDIVLLNALLNRFVILQIYKSVPTMPTGAALNVWWLNVCN